MVKKFCRGLTKWFFLAIISRRFKRDSCVGGTPAMAKTKSRMVQEMKRLIRYLPVIGLVGLLGFFVSGRVAVGLGLVSSETKTMIKKMESNMAGFSKDCGVVMGGNSDLADLETPGTYKTWVPASHDPDDSLAATIKRIEEIVDEADSDMSARLVERNRLCNEADWNLIQSMWYGTMAYTHYVRWYCAEEYDARATMYIDAPNWQWKSDCQGHNPEDD